MKFKKYFLVGLFLAASFLSCKKDKDKEPPMKYPVYGLYEGFWGEGSGALTNELYIDLKVNNDLKRYGNNSQLIATGTYLLDGVSFTAKYTMLQSGEQVSLKGIFNENTGEISGTWGEGNSTVNGGKFVLGKQQI